MNQKGFAPIIIVLLVLAAFLAPAAIKNFHKTPDQTTTSPVSQTAPLEASNSAEQSQNLQKYLITESALLGVADNISLSFHDLTTNQEVNIDPTRSWIPASTIKSFVVLEAFRQRDLGLINFDSTVTIDPQNVVPTELETDEFPRLREGTTATIRQLVEAMVVQSDNTAYNTLLDVLDRRNINATLRNLGLTETVVGEKLNLDDNQFQQDLAVPGRQPNTTTSKDLASLFDLLYSQKVTDADEILGVFKRQKINNMIPALLPGDTQVAHKTGDWAPIYHDGGIIYKPQDPFVLTIFTNTGDPSVISKIAKVAYYQSADSVGSGISSSGRSSNLGDSSVESIALNVEPNVLAETTNNSTTPSVTAADLGITNSDLNPGPQEAQSLRGALILPGSPFYQLKRYFEDVQLRGASQNSDKANAYLKISQDRIAEVKQLLAQNNVTQANSLLQESEQDLKQATMLSQKDQNKDLLLVQVKQVNDMNYAVLAAQSTAVSTQSKEQFIDSVYNFYQQNHQEVTPVIKSSVVASATSQSPAVGTITKIQNNVATLQFDDGSQKQMLLGDNTRVRSFQQQSYQDQSALGVGSTVAVMGITNSNSQIVPQFILNDVPKALPQQHEGTVIEIMPNQNTITILDQKGQTEKIQVGNGTTIQSKDTSVSLAGITAGSVVNVFGVSQQQTGLFGLPVPQLPFQIPGFGGSKSTPSATQIPQTSSPTPGGSGSPNSSPSNRGNQATAGSPNPTGSPTIAPNGNTVGPNASPFSTNQNTNQVKSSPSGSGTTNVGVGGVPSSLVTPKPSANNQVNPPAISNGKPSVQLNAVSIKVIQNNSGKNETVQSKPQSSSSKSSQNKAPSAPAPAAHPPSAPAPKSSSAPQTKNK